MANDRNERWRFLLGDLRAGQWVMGIDSTADDATLRTKFMSLHRFFLRNIGRSRDDIFDGVGHATLVDIVRKWIVLYRAMLDGLRRRYPRTSSSRDLELQGINWSAALGISFEGIMEGVSFASRYAEYWAERSLRDPSVRGSFAARLRFADSAAYWHCLDECYRRRLVILDPLDNGVTAFDLVGATRFARASSLDLRQTFARFGWKIEALSPQAEEVLQWYAAQGPWRPWDSASNTRVEVGAEPRPRDHHAEPV